MDEPEIVPPVSTNAGAAATKAVSPPKESPAISTVVKAVQVTISEKVEDGTAGDMAKSIETTEAPTTEEKKTVHVAPMAEQKKEEEKTVNPATVKESSKKKMTFAEAKAARAKRFGIPIHNGKRQQGHNDKNNKKQKTGKPLQTEGENTKEVETKTPKTDLTKKEMHSLTKKELEQRITRISRFGESTSTENLKKIDELKAILRLHRFTKETEG